MSITEQDAKTRWCPFARVGSEVSGAAINRPERAGYNCIASACMTWRAVPEYEIHRHLNAMRKPEIDRPSGEGWELHPEQGNRNAYWQREKPGVSKGYCGLAGVQP